MFHIASEIKQTAELARLRHRIARHKHIDENSLVQRLLDAPVFSPSQCQTVVTKAKALVEDCRDDTHDRSLLDSFLQEFGLSNTEGVALMCLAEALLRVPDTITADRLIAEKIISGDWQSHHGQSSSIFVNSATWGMMLTGKLVQLDTSITQQPGTWIKSLSSKLSEPIVRRAIMVAMRLMGSQYVLGQTIKQGLVRADDNKTHHNSERYSFDMLGEGARTFEDAQRYHQTYANAIDAIGRHNTLNDVYQANGISVKLSALHPQFHFAHADTVINELIPLIKDLCLKAKDKGLGLSIDAEEAARLDLSLDIFAALAHDPDLSDWDGLGYVLQAYQKRAPYVAKWLLCLAEQTERRIMVRLVKGAYWDSEIKHAQEQGYPDYPVFTRKANTDLCYLHCASILLSEPTLIFAQFATHNASTAVSIIQLANELQHRDFEFQRLHGMGELLYRQLLKHYPEQTFPARVYAPVGKHEDLLPYLVRRLLENGANSSFVNRFLDNAVAVDDLVQDVYQQVSQSRPYRHHKIPIPANLFHFNGETRSNAKGLDLDDARTINKIKHAIEHCQTLAHQGHCIIDGESIIGEQKPVYSPIDQGRKLGDSSPFNITVLQQALNHADNAKAHWSTRAVEERSAILNKMADALEDKAFELIALINQEAGRTIDDCVSEVREAVDFCRFYALRATHASHRALAAQGVFLCISPWNFPLAIFTGQITAALATGNCVLAKPADQTPLLAHYTVNLFHQAGCPTDVLQLLIGDGALIGEHVLSDPRLNGVAFTGSTEVAQRINQTLSKRPVKSHGELIPLIAETGGQNCMVVDSTALPEQVVDDVIASAFHSAGQRCSALRVLYLQDVVADKIVTMLEGALKTVQLGDPALVSTEVGPVIDQNALNKLEQHVNRITPLSSNTMQIKQHRSASRHGVYFRARVFEIDSIKHLTHEVFGPVLHIIRYSMDNIEQVIDDINSTGYALTFGVHSRIEAFADYLCRQTQAGNNYINRTTIGAVVGVTPFGGHGLSGTGPKAGGPNYLYRFQRRLETQPAINNEPPPQSSEKSLKHLLSKQTIKTSTPHWLNMSAEQRCQRIESIIDSDAGINTHSKTKILNCLQVAIRHIAKQRSLPGPTGELNTLIMPPRGTLLIVLTNKDQYASLLTMTSLALCAGNTIELFAMDRTAHLLAEQLQSCFEVLPDGTLRHIEQTTATEYFAVCVSASASIKQSIAEQLAEPTHQSRAIKPVIEFDESVLETKTSLAYISSLIYERTTTENLVARGGNTQLFNL